MGGIGHLSVPVSKMAAILKFFKPQQVRLSRNLMGVIRVTWRFRIAESFSSNIQDGGHSGNLETLQRTSESELLEAV